MPHYAKRSVERINANGTHAFGIRQFLVALENAVDKAYVHVLSDPSLNGLTGLDNHVTHWVQKWTEYLSTGNTQLLGAAFGYAVESLVSADGSPYRPTCPVGYSAAMQVVSGPTRPDVVLMYKGEEVAWFDITSSGDQKHIFTSKVGWTTKENVAEITYPTTDMSVVGGIAQVGYSPLDTRAVDREIRFQKFYQAQFVSILLEMGQALRISLMSVKRISIRDVGGDVQRRAATRGILRNTGPFRGLTLEEDQITVILYALGLIPGTYGFHNSVSEGKGQQIVRDFLQIPRQTAPPEFVPRMLPQPLLPPVIPPPMPQNALALVTSARHEPQFEFPNFTARASEPFPWANPQQFNFSNSAPVSVATRLRPQKTASERFGPKKGLLKPDKFKPARSQSARGTTRFTVGAALADLARSGITFNKITRAGLRYIDPADGTTRTALYMQPGFRPGKKMRRIISLQRATGLDPGETPVATSPLQLPNSAPVVHSIFHLPTQGQPLPPQLSSLQVVDYVVEVKDENEV